jgi:hypothetical protein
VLDSAGRREVTVILNSGLTPGEQRAFTLLLKFFEGEPNAERKALALTTPFAIRAAMVLMAFGEISDDDVAHIVMQIIADFVPDPEVQYLWGERRDNKD